MDSEKFKWNSSSEITFNKETDIFSFDIKAKGNEYIELSLIDKNEHIVYQRKYQEKEIYDQLGKGFDDVTDVMMIFIPLKTVQEKLQQTDLEKVKSGNTISQPELYSYGKTIFNGKASYSIHPNGLIKIEYESERSDVKKKKIYTSELTLTKTRQLTEKDHLSIQLKELRAEFHLKFINLQKQHQYENSALKWELEHKTKLLQKIIPNKYKYFFFLDLPKFTFIGNSSYTQMTIQETIPYHSTAKYKVKIIKSLKKHVLFGVTNVKETYDAQSPHRSGHAIAFSGSDKTIFSNNKALKTGDNNSHFGQVGDVVELIVELSEGRLTWIVNGDQQTTYNWDNLKNASHLYCPYFELYNQDDCIEWIGSQ